MRTDLLLRAQRLRELRTPFVLATVVRAQRPTSAKPGDTALVLPDGTVEGFVGGTCAASTVRLQGLLLIESGAATLLRITPDATPGDEPVLAESEGLVTVANPCLSGGTLDIFLEAVLPPALVYVFGDTPVARAMGTVGESLGYQVMEVTDPATPVPGDTHAVVVASHGRDEEPVLRAALAAGVPYVALVASRKRAAGVLGDMDLTDGQRSRVHAPAGLDIGAHGALEIALSVYAEMVAERPRTGDGGTSPAGAATAEPAALRAARVETAVDPVCGMQVAAVPDAITYEHAGRTWYFCAPGCRAAFAEAPERYGA